MEKRLKIRHPKVFNIVTLLDTILKTCKQKKKGSHLKFFSILLTPSLKGPTMGIYDSVDVCVIHIIIPTTRIAIEFRPVKPC